MFENEELVDNVVDNEEMVDDVGFTADDELEDVDLGEPALNDEEVGEEDSKEDLEADLVGGETKDTAQTEKIIAKRLKEISDEKNRYKEEAEREKHRAEEAVKKATEALNALGLTGSFDEAVDEVLASNKGLTLEEYREEKEAKKKLAEAENVLRAAQAKQLEAEHLAQIKKEFPHVTAASVRELGSDFLDLMSLMYQKEIAGQGKMDAAKAYRLTHIEEVLKHKDNDTAKRSQVKKARSTGGGLSSSTSLPANELAQLEAWNRSCDDPKMRMSVAEYKKKKGLI